MIDAEVQEALDDLAIGHEESGCHCDESMHIADTRCLAPKLCKALEAGRFAEYRKRQEFARGVIGPREAHEIERAFYSTFLAVLRGERKEEG